VSHYSWNEESNAISGSPYPEIYIRNMRAEPLGDGNLRLLLQNHPFHAAAWDAMEYHGLSKEVVLIMDDGEYFYYAQVDSEEDAIYLFPMDDSNETLPDNSRFLEKAFNLKMRW
jgi:hypothetical protein